MSESDRSTDEISESTGKRQESTRTESRKPERAHGNNISDIINRPDTKPIIIQTIGIFISVGIAYGVFGLLAVGQIPTGGAGLPTGGGGLPTGGGSEISSLISIFASVFVTIFIAIVAALAGPIVSLITTTRYDQEVSHLDDKLRYATHAVGSALGQIGLMVISVLLISVSGSPIGIGGFINVILISAVIAGLTATLCSYVLQRPAGLDTE